MERGNGKRRQRGSGHVEELPDGRFRIRLSFRRSDGGRQQPYAYGANPTEAQANADALRRRWSGLPVPVETVAEIVEAWIAQHRDAWAPNTILLRQTYARRKIIPSLGKIALAQFSRNDFARFIAQVQCDGTAPCARRAAALTLRAALRWGVAQGLLPSDPIALARSEAPQRKPIEPYSIEEAQRLLAAARQNPQLFALLALMGPLRQGECFALLRRDLDFANNTVSVEATLSDDVDYKIIRKAPKTPTSRRKLTMEPEVMAALAALADCDPDDLIFCDSNGGPLRRSNFDRREFHPLLVRAGLRRVTFHSLRHSAVSILAAKGVPWTVIQYRGGWKSVRTVLEIYALALHGDEASASAVMGDVFATVLRQPAVKGQPRYALEWRALVLSS